MIDRGALILGPARVGPYRGAHRTPLDGMAFTGRKGKHLGRRYAEAIVAGDSVLDDLDEAITMCREARAMGITEVEVVVFEVPQTPFSAVRLPIVEPPPADDLVLLGWDVIQPIEPWCSPLSEPGDIAGLNAHGLFSTRHQAEDVAASLNASGDPDEPYVAAKIWVLATN